MGQDKPCPMLLSFLLIVLNSALCLSCFMKIPSIPTKVNVLLANITIILIYTII